MEYRVDRYGDTTITIRKIKINDIHKWNSMKVEDIVNEKLDSCIERKTEKNVG